MGTNICDRDIEPTMGVLRTPHMEANTQTSIPTVEVLIPPVLGDNTIIPHVSLSISGYEHYSLWTSGIRSPPVRAWEVSMIPQLDEPGSLPIRDHTRGRMGRFSDQIELDPSQGGTYVQRASMIRRREYPGEGSGSDYYRKLHRDQRPPDRGGHPNGGGRPHDRGGYPDGGGRPPDRGGYPNGGGRPPDRGGHPNVGGRPTDRWGHPDGGGRPPDRGGYPHGCGRPPDRGGYPYGGGRPPDRGGYPGEEPPDGDGGPPRPPEDKDP